LDAFIFTDRGVYRPGEKVNIGVLVRQLSGDAAPGFPVRLSFTQPNGLTLPEQPVVADQGEGGRAFTWSIPSDARPGRWRVSVAAMDNLSSPIATAKFVVEDYRPDRIDFDLTARSQMVTPGKPVQLDVSGRFLFGAPAAGL